MSSDLFKRFLKPLLALWYIDRLTRVTATTCRTKDCQDFAKKIITSMNDSVDPCVDFYKYSCGSWKSHHPLPEGELEWSDDNLVRENILQKIRVILEEPYDPNNLASIKKLKRFYRSCMNTKRLEKIGVTRLVDVIDTTGGWPIAMSTSTWKSEVIPWQEVDTIYSDIDGTNAFFSLIYSHDDVNLTRRILVLDQEASYTFLKNSKQTDINGEITIGAFAKMIAKAATAVMDYNKVEMDRDQFVTDVTEILQLQFAFHDIQYMDQKKEKRDMEKMTIGNLQEWYDSLPRENSTSDIDWLSLIQSAFNVINETITPDESIFVTSKESLRQLAKLLDKTSERTIVNYVQWVFVSRYIPYTTKTLREAEYEVYSEVYNTTFQIPRWKECISHVGMKDAIAYAFVKKHFDKRVKYEAEEMVDGIKKQIALGITKTHWTSKAMKIHMIEKLDAVEEQIGYPEWYLDEENIDTIYQDLEIGDDFFLNVLNYGRFGVMIRAIQFFEPISEDAWLEYPTTLNAFYSELDNVIIVPAAELQAPYFSPGLPDAINYGRVGFLIGHELSHGFDHTGINYDKHGNKVTKKVQELLEIYKSKAKCFVDQFNAFSLNHTDENGNLIQLNGNLTENENIADSAGIKVAYLAYQEKAKNSSYMTLPNLEHFSQDQLFFLSFATSWCNVLHPVYEKSSLNLDVHSPSNFRIIGSLQNMPSFGSAFDCSEGTVMNPKKKCAIWA